MRRGRCEVLLALGQDLDLFAVADGAEFIPTAKAIFEDCYDAFTALQSDDAQKKAAREQSLADYVAEHQLPVKYYQDFGWDAIEIPAI